MRVDQIKDKESFGAWLNARPEETRGWENAVLAWRAAARVLPLTISADADQRGLHIIPKLTFQSMRAIALARALTIAPAFAKELTPKLLSLIDDSLIQAAFGNDDSTAVINLSAASARCAVEEAFFTIFSKPQAQAATLAAAAVATEAYDMWESIGTDCSRIELNGWDSLITVPLWPAEIQQIPKIFSIPDSIFLNSLRHQNMQRVWLNWYKRVFQGKLQSTAEEMLYCDAELDDLWDKDDGFAQVTAWIAAKLAELEEVTTNRRDFFISYNNADELVAKEMSAVLESAGYSTYA